MALSVSGQEETLEAVETSNLVASYDRRGSERPKTANAVGTITIEQRTGLASARYRKSSAVKTPRQISAKDTAGSSHNVMASSQQPTLLTSSARTYRAEEPISLKKFTHLAP